MNSVPLWFVKKGGSQSGFGITYFRQAALVADIKAVTSSLLVKSREKTKDLARIVSSALQQILSSLTIYRD